jgi:transposase
MANASLDDGHQGGTYRRIELITGAPRRRRWTAEEKARILAESFQPEARVSDVALRHGVNRGLVWSWRRQVRKHEAETEPGFVPIRIAQNTAAPQSSAAVERHEAPALRPAVPPAEAKAEAAAAGSIDIEMAGVRVRVSGAVDTAALRTVLSHFGRAR